MEFHIDLPEEVVKKGKEYAEIHDELNFLGWSRDKN